jgi:hypothetical protein
MSNMEVVLEESGTVYSSRTGVSDSSVLSCAFSIVSVRPVSVCPVLPWPLFFHSPLFSQPLIDISCPL